MASTNWPSTAGGRAVSDIQYELIGRQFSRNGIVGYPGDADPVYGDSSGRQVRFRAARYAVIHGHGWSSGASSTIVAVTANSSGSTRYDLACLRLDRTTWAITEIVKAGTPGAGVPPAVTQDSLGTSTGVWEVPLAVITVVNGAATISSGDVVPCAPFIAGGDIVGVENQAALAYLGSSITTQLAWVYDESLLYNYTGSAWRRADWNSAWGVIGGRQYASTNATIAAAIAAETVIQSTAAVDVVAGRRYRINMRCKITPSADGGTAQLVLRETNASGTVHGYYFAHRLAGFTGHMIDWTSEYNETTSTSRTFCLTAGPYGGGTVTASRGDQANGQVFVAVEDIGPSSLVTSVA